jgi:DNA mismatch repair protein MutH
MAKLYLQEALEKILELEGARLGDIGDPDLVNKGIAGQIVEKKIGLNLSSDLLDFEDGELKSNKFLNGKPRETLAVTQVGHILSEIEAGISWEKSKVLKKISSFIFLPIHKDDSDPRNWVIGRATHFSRNQYPESYKKLEVDYVEVSRQINMVLKTAGQLHTFNGPNEYLQIRTKDAKDKYGKYHPVMYNHRALSNKNYAFYLRPGFLNSVLNQGV